MNILQLLPELRSGGVERGTIDLAKYLKRHGHGSVVVSAGGPLVGELAAAGVPHYALPVHKKSLFAILKSASALERIVRAERVDVIHARSRVPAIVGYLVSRRTHVPFVTTCHGFYSKHLFSRVMGWGKLVIVASHIIGKRMRDDFRVPHERIRLIPRGVNLEEFHYAEDRFAPERRQQLVVGMVGRLTPIKGHPLFLKAMARVARVYPNVKIQIIGDASKPQYKEELQMLTRRLGLSQTVEYLGTRYDIPALMAGMSVLVAPSVGEEAFGRVVIEAGACGVPVVATRLGGFVDILEHDRDGLLVPPDDPRVLADAVIRLLKEVETARAFARALREKVEKQFGLERMFDRTLKVYEEAVTRKRILVMKMSAVGDVILSIPSIRAIRQKFPDAWIAVLVGRKSRPIIRNCPYVDDVIVHEDTGRWASLARTARLLARESFDVVVDLQNNRVSHLLAYLSGARIRAGHGNRKWSFFLNRRTRDTHLPLSPVDHQFQVLKLIDIDHFDKRLELWTRPEEEKRVSEFLESQWVSPSQTLVGVNPGSSLRWPTKQWPVENFARLCDELAKRNVRVILTGSAEEAPLAEELLRLTRNKPVNAVGRTTITELVALVRRCQAFISSDSAPMHVASSVDVPLAAIFGPTDPKRHLVPPTRYHVFWKELSCSPCYLRSCPIGLTCMKKIQVQDVLEAVQYFLKDKPAPPSAAPAAPGPAQPPTFQGLLDGLQGPRGRK